MVVIVLSTRSMEFRGGNKIKSRFYGIGIGRERGRGDGRKKFFREVRVLFVF